MKIELSQSYMLNLGYAYLLKQNYNPKISNPILNIIKRFNKKVKIPKRKIPFHHSKLGRLMLLLDNEFKIKKKLNKTDKFDIKFCKHLIPEIEKYHSQFKEFYETNMISKEIALTNKFKNALSNELKRVQRHWKIKEPRKITILNNSLAPGGHLYLLQNQTPIITINLLNKYENMIKHIAIHEFSHYFQNQIFNKLKKELSVSKDKFRAGRNNYLEWESWFAENLIEAVIITNIKKPLRDKEKEILRHIFRKYNHAKKIMEIINENKFKKIGVSETKEILEGLNSDNQKP